LVKTSTTSHSPKITPDYLLKQTRRQSILSAIFCWIWISISLLVVTEAQLFVLWKPVLLIASSVSCFALMRNRILDRIYRRLSFATHYQIKSILRIPIGAFLAIAFGTILLGDRGLPREILGPIVVAGFVIGSFLWSIGQVVTDESEASLLLSQFIYEIGKGKKTTRCFRWLDRGLDRAIRVLRQYNITVDGPTLRLGARMYCLDQNTDVKYLVVMSKTIMKMEESELSSFTELRLAIEALTDIGKRAIDRGFSPRPRITDYIDLRYLSLTNVYRMLAIILVIVILVFILTGHLQLR
jgi:hypothetical protein